MQHLMWVNFSKHKNNPVRSVAQFDLQMLLVQVELQQLLVQLCGTNGLPAGQCASRWNPKQKIKAWCSSDSLYFVTHIRPTSSCWDRLLDHFHELVQICAHLKWRQDQSSFVCQCPLPHVTSWLRSCGVFSLMTPYINSFWNEIDNTIVSAFDCEPFELAVIKRMQMNQAEC